ncbi:hypothetical protein [Microcoleus sp. CAWBG58]|uniref:hypothetical protein n=1 Tax=Microcoleus sp. CAWBG58 TaxID=2841651 RepID=UPI0025E6C7C2|nr:hypothetical protein [Microcoleus sp. CAWBG58]
MGKFPSALLKVWCGTFFDMLDAVLRLRADKQIAAGSSLVGPKVRSTVTVKRF